VKSGDLLLFPAYPRLAAIVACFIALAAIPACAEDPPGRPDRDAVSDQAGPCSLTVVQWNVENLFDADDDPANAGDDEFLPGSWRHWNTRRYSDKVANVARVLADAAGDIVCLAEVENRRALDDLRETLAGKHGLDYRAVAHREGPDHRGIEVAILSRFRARRVEYLLPVPEQREIVVADFSAAGQPVTVIANHWKSRYMEPDGAGGLRAIQAAAVAGVVDRRLKADPATAIVVAGDFNDDFDAPALLDVLGSTTNLALAAAPGGPRLFNLHAGLDPAKRGTIYYRKGKKWNSFDSMHVSRALLDPGLSPGGWKVSRDSYEVFSRPYMLRDGIPLPYRIGSQPGTKKRVYLTGFSDHLPVRVSLELGSLLTARQR